MVKKSLYILYIGILIICIFVFTTPVLAAECTDDELDSLIILAEKIEISSDFKGKLEGNYLFSVTAYNLNDKFYLELPNGLKFIPTSSSEFLGSFFGDNKIDVAVYASDKTSCQDEELTSISVKLPKFNEYSTREECTDKKHLDVCKEFFDSSNITEEQFKKIISDSQNTQDEDEVDNNIIRFITDNLKYIVIAIGTVLVIITIVVRVRNKKKVKIDI